MIDLSRKPRTQQQESWEPEEIAVAALALLIWLPLAFLIGGLL